jgi:hypothetical protein
MARPSEHPCSTSPIERCRPSCRSDETFPGLQPQSCAIEIRVDPPVGWTLGSGGDIRTRSLRRSSVEASSWHPAEFRPKPLSSRAGRVRRSRDRSGSATPRCGAGSTRVAERRDRDADPGSLPKCERAELKVAPEAHGPGADGLGEPSECRHRVKTDPLSPGEFSRSSHHPVVSSVDARRELLRVFAIRVACADAC